MNAANELQQSDVTNPNYFQYALAIAKHDIPVAFVPAGEKGARTSAWQDLATTSPELLREFAQANPGFTNIAAVAKAVPGGRLMLDDDDDILQEYEKVHGPCTATLTAQSCNDAYHYFFEHTKKSLAFHTARGKSYIAEPGEKGERWSLRMHNAYVIAPGSIVKNDAGIPTMYQIVHDTPIAPMPDSLLDFLIERYESAKAKPKLASVPSTSKAKSILVPDAPVLEGGRNTKIAREAGILREQGKSSEADIQQAMLDLNVKSCVPPLDDKEVLDVVASICRNYEQGKPHGLLFDGKESGYVEDIGYDFAKIDPKLLELPIGKSAVRPFEELADTSDPAKRSWIFEHLRVTADELSDKPQSWLLNEMLLEHGLHLFSGKAGSMKSMLALMLAKAAATSEPFLLRENIGHRTSVVYIDRENPESEQRKRCAALGLLHLPNFRIWGDWHEEWPPPLGFDDPRLVESAKRDKPLFIFDSLSSYLNGEDENGTAEMMQIMGKARSLARMSAGVIILHHTPKNGPPSARGNTAITASTDMAFIVSKEGRKVTLKEDRFRPCGSYVMSFEMDFGGITGVYKASLVMDTARSILEVPSQLDQMKANDRQATEETTRQHHIDAAKAIIERQYGLGEPVRSRAALCGLMGVNPTGRFAKENLNGCEGNPWTCVLNNRSLAFLPKGVTKMPETGPERAGETVH